MFKIIISEQFYGKIKQEEQGWAPQEQSYLYKLLQQQPVQLLSAAKTEELKAHPENVLKNPSALYVLDLTPSEALTIKRLFGVMCLSTELPDISPLIDVNDIHVSNEQEKLGRGWDSVLDSVETLPSNALLLTDRYLFAFRHPNAGDGIANIHDILDQLLPQQFLGGDYHVTIVFDNMAKHSSYTFNDITTQLNRLKQHLKRDYPIMMEVLGITPDCAIYNKLHNRLIVSNYYLVEAGHKLAAFNHERATARQMLVPLTLFTESSLNGTSTPPLKAIEQTISTLRDFSSSLSRLTDHSIYLYAVNGQRMERCMGIRNRLLKG
ncbi:MAG: hypothetical protein K5656_09615 [Lachnospiraceae bacterium]|nr:hypothetical protein [Lachnospiraceae bacterium]